MTINIKTCQSWRQGVELTSRRYPGDHDSPGSSVMGIKEWIKKAINRTKRVKVYEVDVGQEILIPIKHKKYAKRKTKKASR